MDDTEKIKQKLDLVDFITQFVVLKKAGRNFNGLCPFHNEKSPSFMVSPERQIWHCFGCGKGGDIFSFVMEYDKVDFSESLKFLADKAGIKLTQSVFKTELEQKKEKIYALNRLAAQFYTFLLTKHSAGKSALSYLKDKRQLSEPLINKFELGYAPKNPSTLSEYLTKKKKYKAQELVDAGLATQKGNRLYDFFRNRIIFPITDVRGNIIAFSGRALDDSALPKYINTRETLVYKKGDTAYGLYFAKDSIKKEDKILIVEGEFDVISCFKEGISNVVAIKGTALTESQIRLFKRYARKFLFCFDTDGAGSNAQRRSIEMIEKEGVSAAVIVPPEGKDPDELLKENPALFKKAIKDEVSIYDFIISSSMKGFNPDTPDGKREILVKALPLLSAIENEVIKEHYLRKLAERLDTSFESVLRQSNKALFPTQPIEKPAKSAPKESREHIVEGYLLSLLAQAKDIGAATRTTQPLLQDITLVTPAIQKIYTKLAVASQADTFDSTTFVKSLPPELAATYDKCCLYPVAEFEDESEYFKEIEKKAREVRELAIRFQLHDLGEQIKSLEKSGSDEQVDELRLKFSDLTQLLHS